MFLAQFLKLFHCKPFSFPFHLCRVSLHRICLLMSYWNPLEKAEAPLSHCGILHSGSLLSRHDSCYIAKANKSTFLTRQGTLISNISHLIPSPLSHCRIHDDHVIPMSRNLMIPYWRHQIGDNLTFIWKLLSNVESANYCEVASIVYFETFLSALSRNPIT